MISSKAEMELLQSLNLDCKHLKYANSQDLSRAVLTKWITKSYADIMWNTILSMKDVVASQEPSTTLPEHIRFYTSNAPLSKCLHYLAHIREKTSRFVRPIPLVVTISSYYGVSCHELMFREKVAPVLSQREACFIRAMRRMDPKNREMIKLLLSRRAEPICDIQHIMRLRMMEMASERATYFKHLVFSSGFLDRIQSSINEFVADSAALFRTPVDGIKEKNVYLNDSRFCHVLYSICLYYNVSADYLLLQDYSQLAVMPDGTELDAEDRHLLSLLQCANYTTQLNVYNLIATKFLDNGIQEL